jgi:catechol 2,3-dioxygenase-like lactoylglutathione lyase family enzyme
MKKKMILLLLVPGFLLGFSMGVKHKDAMIKDQKMTQVGVVVRDIEQASKAWASFLGLEEVPEWSIAAGHESRPTQYKGKPSGATAKLAFFQLENITIELIEPLEGPSTWHDFLETHGPGIHHIAFDVGNMKQTVEQMEQSGIKEEQHGGWGSGEYAYMNGSGSIELIVELLEHYTD